MPAKEVKERKWFYDYGVGFKNTARDLKSEFRTTALANTLVACDW
jgi:hypothetical protein